MRRAENGEIRRFFVARPILESILRGASRVHFRSSHNGTRLERVMSIQEGGWIRIRQKEGSGHPVPLLFLETTVSESSGEK